MTTEAVTVCRDCGHDIVRRPTYLVCDCRMGLVAQWDQSLGEGPYLGRIVDPVAISVPRPEELMTQ
jgi:hypothetical protein